jgi:hypothetical protein
MHPMNHDALAKTRRVAPALYGLIVLAAGVLLFAVDDYLLAAVLIVTNAAMLITIRTVSRRPPDGKTGPKLR